ncbi:MAG: hypothetical protein QM758_26995 [Armatimonas sp.]
MSTSELVQERAERPARAKGDSWKAMAVAATLAAFVFAGGIGWLARERQKNLASISQLQEKLKTQQSDQEALQRRLYDQNREMAGLNTRIRERESKITSLLTQLSAAEKAAALASKERDEWRARAAAQPTMPVMVAPTPLEAGAQDRVPPESENQAPRRKHSRR